MEADVVNLGKEIDKLEKQSAIDMELNKAVGSPIFEKPTNKKVKTERASDEYKKDFLNVLRGKPQIYNIMQESVDADGGFLVPEEFENQIVTALEENNVIRSIAKTITTAAERKIPIAATHSVAQWTPENGADKSYLISIDKVWSAYSGDTYMQIVPVNGIKETDIAVVCIETSKDEFLADKELEIWNRITRIVINSGSITVYIKGKMPDISIKIRIKT